MKVPSHFGEVLGGVTIDLVDGKAHLHLMNPALRQVLGEVEPDRYRSVAGPDDGTAVVKIHLRTGCAD